MDSTAIKAIADLAIAATHAAHLGTPTPALIDNGKVISIEYLQAGRSRFRGRLVTASLPDFVGYVRAHANNAASAAHGFIDADALAATAIFNLGDEASPGHADDVAVLVLKPTAAYRAVQFIDGKRLGQKQFAEWLEDWSQHLTAFAGFGDVIPLVAAIAAVRSVKVKKTNEATSTVRNFGATRSALEDIEAQANGAAALPDALEFQCTPYLGLAEQSAELRISVITDEDKPTFSIRWARREQAEESIAQDFKRLLTDEVGDSASMTIGTFTP